MSVDVGAPAPTTPADRFWRHCDVDPRTAAELVGFAEQARADPYQHTAVDSPMLARPMFLTEADCDTLGTSLQDLQDLLVSLPERIFDGDVAAMCARLGMPPTHQMAIEETWSDKRVLLNRTDLARTGHSSEAGFQALEVNLHSSLGGVDCGPWHRAWLDVPFFADFARREQLRYVDPVHAVAGHLRSVARAAGLGVFPSLAIVDWPTSYPAVAARLHRLAGLFRARGFDAFACHAGELQFAGGRLRAGGRRIDIVYRVFVVEEVAQNPRLLLPILAAHRAGTAVLAMGFLAELVGNKGALAMLSDPQYRTAFTAAERDRIDRILPATRFVRDATTDWNGERVNVLELADRERTDLVLKPSGGHSAHGVTAGWRCDPASWRAAVAAAVDRPWVLQRRLRGVPEAVPVPEPLGSPPRWMDVNWGVFLVDRAFAGAMIRARPSADEDVISTAVGAAVGSCFIAP